MYGSYRSSGLFDASALRKIGGIVGSRYLVQLKLASFSQDSQGGIAPFFGISLTHREAANVRLFAQIWDSTNGKIVWEKTGEASKSSRSLRDKPIPMQEVLKAAAEKVVQQLPR